MRTTLILDDDVVAQLERMRRKRGVRFRTLVNDVLRRGLQNMNEVPLKREAVLTQTFDMGRPLINIDNVTEALSLLEGDCFK